MTHATHKATQGTAAKFIEETLLPWLEKAEEAERDIRAVPASSISDAQESETYLKAFEGMRVVRQFLEAHRDEWEGE